ncbi:MAG: MBL fold metallo-hydrolase [Chitinophagaceae bacterium]|jgi:phosphoribosyl 1,2-cyclic phosphodiesterase
MSLYCASLNSGSNGNCYYVGNETEGILVDIGLTCRETEKRLKSAGIGLDKIKAIFVSHEHGDHIKGVEVFSKKNNIPVYITAKTLKSSRLRLEEKLTVDLNPNSEILINGLRIISFSKFHDAADPCSFLVKGNGISVGVFTDLGNVCSNLIKHFSQCHAAFLEANYDDSLLENGRYPYHLKKRIRGGEGHLSNVQAMELFQNHGGPFLKHLFLSHLSKENNCPEIAKSLFESFNHKTKIYIASRDCHSELYHIRQINEDHQPAILNSLFSNQLKLF